MPRFRYHTSSASPLEPGFNKIQLAPSDLAELLPCGRVPRNHGRIDGLSRACKISNSIVVRWLMSWTSRKDSIYLGRLDQLAHDKSAGITS